MCSMVVARSISQYMYMYIVYQWAMVGIVRDLLSQECQHTLCWGNGPVSLSLSPHTARKGWETIQEETGSVTRNASMECFEGKLSNLYVLIIYCHAPCSSTHPTANKTVMSTFGGLRNLSYSRSGFSLPLAGGGPHHQGNLAAVQRQEVSTHTVALGS